MQHTSINMPKPALTRNKMTRTDRFVQMSQQEMLIEQKKREIQAKLEAKRRQNNQELKERTSKPPPNIELPTPSKEASQTGVNQYSNDGSFLNQFKQLKEKKRDSKFKTFNKYKDKEREREKEKEKEREQERQKETENESSQDEGGNDDKKEHEGSSPSPSDDQSIPEDLLPLDFDPQQLVFDTSFMSNPPPSLNHFNQGPPPQIPQAQPGLDGQTGPLLGPPPPLNTLVPPLLSEFSVPAQLSLTSAETITFTSPPQLTTISPQLNTNIAPPTAQIITSTVTQQLTSPTPLPSILQQPIGPITAPASDLATPAGQIGPVNLPTAAPTIQQTQTVMTQALAPPTLFATTTGTEQIVSAPQQVLLNVPPPQILPQTQLVLTPQDQNVLVSAPASILTTVTLPPPVMAPQNINVSTPNALNVRPPGLPTVELTSIPPPNPIQVQNIPQPEPLNTLNIPPPAPLQVSSIPTPSSLHLNEIPNPKPLDLMAIPTPNEDEDDFTDTSFLKNIPPPNKSLPPPNVADVNFLGSSNQQRSVTGSSQMTSLPPTPPPQSSATRIPSLMSQRVLPPPGMGVNIPPPMIHSRDVSQPPPNFSRQGPPPMPNLNIPPPMIGPPGGIPHIGGFKDEIAGGAEFEAMANLARMVAECGPSVEDVVRQKKNRDPDLWFLFHKESAAYRQYANLVEQYKRECEDEEEMEERLETKPDPSEIYEPEMALEDDDVEQDREDDFDVKQEIKQEDYPSISESTRRERKRKSRWGEKDHDVKPPVVLPVMVPPMGAFMPPVPSVSPMLSKLTRTDPGLLQYAVQTYGTTNLSDEDWKKAEDNYKIHLLYQDMLKKREELKKLEMQGKNKYEYDSDEETEGGTWEHKLRDKEMQATERWATELTRQAEGKHHIGDFLPPEELKRFMEKSNAVKEGRQPNFSDYKEFKIKEDNIGFKMLQKLGWSEGEGLGQNSGGIVEPVNKGAPRENTQGLGLNLNEATEDEDEYESYRKRMMLAYRFRPNPLNNPRRPYY